jgi:heterodisulfide reductase subunit A
MGIGAHRGLPLGVPGEDVEGVILGIDYLREINLGRPQPTGKRVAVIGGGNTAMDVARTARRQGAEVAILYRRTSAEMPADQEEVEGAIAEGVMIDYLVTPLEVVAEDGRVTALECIMTELGEPDASGRARPVPIEGSEHLRHFDMIIPSVSQQPYRNWYEDDPVSQGTIDFTKWDTLIVDADSLQTGIPGVFGGGDVVLGPASIVEAMGQGRRAAEAIDKYLQGQPLESFSTHVAPPDPVRGFVKRPYAQGPAYDEIPKVPRAHLEARDPTARLADYEDVDVGLTEEQGIREAARCLHCGVCVECRSCQNICPPNAIRLDMKDEIVELDVGQILVATGFKSFDPTRMTPYGYGRYDNVITSVEFERMLNSTGPTGGQILCKNGKPPRAVGIVHCVGSRDENYNRYCSRVCCMAALKFAHLVKDRTDADLYEFYIDMRAFGKGYEEFYLRVLEEGANVIRGKVAEIVPARGANGDSGHLIVRAEDTLIGRYREIPVDMVVLMGAIEPQPDAEQVGRIFSLSRSPDGFFLERHPKLDPVGTTTDGVYVAGCSQGPKDIPDTVAQAQAAAASILAKIAKGEVIIEPVRATVEEHLCGGCKTCLNLCPYTAITFDEGSNVAVINQALCKGCGTCVAACPAAAITGAGFTDEQILAELEGILAPVG